MRQLLFLVALCLAVAGLGRLRTPAPRVVATPLPARVPPVPPEAAPEPPPPEPSVASRFGRRVDRGRVARRTGVFVSTSLVAMLLLAVLAGLGMANGLWGKNLVLDASVETGDLRADWDKLKTVDICGGIDVEEAPKALTQEEEGSLELQTFSGGDHDEDPCPPDDCNHFDDDCEPACPDFESLTLGGGGHDDGDDDCVPRPKCDVVGGAGTQEAEIKITGAREGYWCIFTGWVGNTGSVPFNIIGAKMIINNGNEAGLQEGFPPHWYPGCKLPDVIQVDPSDDAKIECKVSVKPTAEHGTTYYFAVEVCVAQWNEDPSPGGSSSDFNACKNSPQHEGPDTPILPEPDETEENEADS